MKAEYLNATQAYSAGALLSSIDDLARWEEVLAEGRLVRPDLLALARTPARYGGGKEEAAYGFGWELGHIDGRRAVGHGGTISGFRTYEVSVPSLDLYVAILCNADRPPADPAQVAERITRLAAGEAPRPADAVQAIPFVGQYRLGPTQSVSVRLVGGELFLEPAGLAPRRLSALSATSFVDVESADWYGFRRDEIGRISGLEIRPRSGPARVLARVPGLDHSYLDARLSARAVASE